MPLGKKTCSQDRSLSKFIVSQYQMFGIELLISNFRDDNKILTLASNERIALTPEMRLIFEISNLRTATPATVSRYSKKVKQGQVR